MLFEIILTLLLSKSIKSSIVIDGTSQNGIYLPDYCPKMKFCPEGAHIMCMYYNPNSVMGPRCRNARNVTMTPDLANKLLDVSNAIRSKIARGDEKGKNGEHFPRGYGIFRLKWDTELATFAQVLANQCVLRHDLCRATKRFADPGQTAGLVRFSVPDWYPVSKSGNFSTPGLDNDKLLYATTQTLKSWYGQKSSVSVQMLTNYPDWSVDPDHQNGRLYMEMIYGPATHMGCGISAYTEYAFYDNNAALNYNSIQIICNFSARPRSGNAVYNTVPPTDLDNSFNTCGCPAGSIEDDDCLCHEVSKEPEPPSTILSKARQCPDGDCDPTVVLLPIFTVEDAPPDKLIPPERFSNTSQQMGRMNDLDSFEELIGHNILQNKKSNIGPSKVTTKTRSKGQNQRSKTNGISVRYRHFDNPPKDPNNHQAYNVHHVQRPSIFSKTPRFELPRSQDFITSIKRDVVPRKDFSTGKKLVGKYLIGKNSITLPRDKSFSNSYSYIMSGLNEPKSVETPNILKDLHVYLHPKEQGKDLTNRDDLHFHDILTTETILNTAEQRVINNKKFMKTLNISHAHNKPEVSEENDHKLIDILDNLEQEVNHIELHDKEKKILDAKIKKIYGNVIGERVRLNRELKQNEDIKPNKFKVIVIKDHDDMYEDNNDVHKLEPPHDSVKYDRDFVDHSFYHSAPHDIDVDGDDKYTKQEFNDIERDVFSRGMISKDQTSLVDYDKRDKFSHHNKNNIRERNQNDINSLEFFHPKYNKKCSGRPPFSHNIISNGIVKSKQRSNVDRALRRKSYYENDYWYDDPLSAERRKYYQEKLDSVQRKLQDVRRSNHRNAVSRPQLRAMRPSVRSDNHIDPLYTSGRARFLHGY